MPKACHVRMSYLDVFFQIGRIVGQSWWGGTSGASPSWVPDPHASFIWTNVIVVASGKTHKCYLRIKEKNSQEKILEQLLIHATFQLDCQDCLAGIITFKIQAVSICLFGQILSSYQGEKLSRKNTWETFHICHISTWMTILSGRYHNFLMFKLYLFTHLKIND